MRELAFACTLTYQSLSTFFVFAILQSNLLLPGRLCVYLCVSVCGLRWKHVLAASRVNVRRTWGRSHYHAPYPPLLTPPSPPPQRIYSQHPLANTRHSFSLFLSVSLSIMVNNTLPHSRSAIAKKKKKTQVLQDACILLLLYIKK